MISARTVSEGPEMRTVRQLGTVSVRLKPLGMDRERRRYWLLARGEVREAERSSWKNVGQTDHDLQ